jgi:hypothetical protein
LTIFEPKILTDLLHNLIAKACIISCSNFEVIQNDIKCEFQHLVLVDVKMYLSLLPVLFGAYVLFFSVNVIKGQGSSLMKRRKEIKREFMNLSSPSKFGLYFKP